MKKRGDPRKFEKRVKHKWLTCKFPLLKEIYKWKKCFIKAVILRIQSIEGNNVDPEDLAYNKPYRFLRRKIYWGIKSQKNCRTEVV